MEPYQSALRYWEQQVRGVEPSSLSPFGEAIVPLPTQQQSIDLTGEELETLLDLSRTSGATLFSTVVAALAYLRAEDSGSTDVRLLTLKRRTGLTGNWIAWLVCCLTRCCSACRSVRKMSSAKLIARASTGVREGALARTGAFACHV